MTLGGSKPKVRALCFFGVSPVPQNAPLYFELSVLTSSSGYSVFELMNIFRVEMSTPPFQNYILFY